MKDFITVVIAASGLGLLALGGILLILICQPLFWFALMVLILASKF